MIDPKREAAEGARLARRAVELGRDDAVALSRGGHALAHFTGDLDGGIALHDRALMLNPNLAAAWFLGGFLRVWHGEPDGAIEHFARAMRLSPLDPETYRMQAGMAAAHLFAGRFDAASSWADKASSDLPSFLLVAAVAAASHALAGRTEKAAAPWIICASWILCCAFPISGTGFRSTGRKISRRLRTACAGQGCRNRAPEMT
jgi:tetratricopeptide (TPR) repeat protein